MVCLVTAIYLGAYIYFMFKNPDALRSETFTLRKMAIEKSLHGDDLTGLTSQKGGDQRATEPQRIDVMDSQIIESEVQDGA